MRVRFDHTLNWNTLVLLLGFIATGVLGYAALRANDEKFEVRLTESRAYLMRLESDSRDNLRRLESDMVSSRTRVDTLMEALKVQLETQNRERYQGLHDRLSGIERRTDASLNRIEGEIVKLRDRLLPVKEEAK